MKLVPVILACLLAYVPVEAKWSSFECPPPDSIYPCECTTFPRKVVKCNDVKNLDIVREALANRFAAPLPKLQISDVHTFALPHHAFRNISARRLVLTSSNIRRIHDDAFDGQEGLGLLILSEDRLSEFPTLALSRLHGLQTLSLFGNFLVKVTDQSLDGLYNLQHLVLSNNRISRIERHAFPRTLETLALSSNLLDTLNRSVINLSRLSILFVSENRLSTVKGDFRGLFHLKHLSLDMNKLSDISNSFEDLVALESLNLAYNKLETLEGLHPLTRLKRLNVSYNYITELDMNLFEHLSQIEVLDLSGNYLKTVCPQLSPLKRLRELNLSETGLRSLEYDCFKEIKNLQVLDLSHNMLTNIDAITGHSFPKINFLFLKDNKISVLKHGFKNLRNLHELDISDNSLTTLKGHHLMHNRMLKIFRIGGNPWECSVHLNHVFRGLELRMINIIDQPYCYLFDNVL